MRFIISGGGTGGHIYPGISLAREIRERNGINEVVFVGSNKGLEAKIIPREGFAFFPIKVRGMKRKICWESFTAIMLFLLSLFSAYRIIKKIKPHCVIGTGGYVSSSIVFLASIMGIPTFIHEQNAIPGITNQLLSLKSRLVLTSFEDTKKHIWNKKNTLFVGNPVREAIWQGNKRALLRCTNLSAKKKTILVFGGSRGANAINQAVLDSLALINKKNWDQWQILMICGEDNLSLMKENTKNWQNIVQLIPYLYRIEDAYDLADLVICRAGATTIAEIAATGLPAILIPYPYATGNHQLYNARCLEKQKAAIVIKEIDLSGKKLAQILTELLNDHHKINSLAANSKKIGNQKATKKIMDLIFREIKQND